ncbi:MAG: hypothetical protein DRO23_00345 [Thermoprotei archaeon]|nr:MAG: hypothetical protein DRO23_00345 [Thermoprotei archaeon]
MKKPVRAIQYNLEDPYGYFISKFTAKKLVNYTKRMHANVIVVFARDAWGRRLYLKGKVAPKHPRLTKETCLEELVKLASENNIKVVIMVAHTANKHMYEEHPEWVQVNVKGEPVILEHVPFGVAIKHPQWPLLCLNSPYMSYLEQEVKEAISIIKPYAVLLDSFRYQPDYQKACYCKYCREKFRKETGYDLPEEENWESREWKEAWKWRYKVVLESMRKLWKIAKEAKKDIVFMYNNHPAGWSGRANKVLEEARDIIDAVFAECSEADHQPPGFISEMVRLTKAMSGGKPIWASRNAFHMYRTVTSTTPLAVKQGLREAFIAGGSPWILFFSSTLTQDARIMDAVSEVYSEIEKLEDYMEYAEPLKYVGIIASNNTRDWYGRDNPASYVDETRGFYYALIHKHIPVEFVTDKDLENYERLKDYKLLILANNACISDKALDNIRKYVKNKGKLIVTYQATILNEEGIERGDFGLSDIMGFHYEGLFETPWSYTVIEKEDLLSKGVPKTILLGDMSYTFRKTRVEHGLGNHARLRVESDEVEVVAKVALPLAVYGYEYTLGRSPPPIGPLTEEPSIVRSFSLVYFSFQLGRHYWRLGLPEYSGLIANSIKYLVSERPVIEVEAPETIEASVFKGKDYYIVHLLNHTYNQRMLSTFIGKSRQATPGYSQPFAVHPPRTVIPILNVRLKANLKEDWRKVKIILPLRGIEKKVNLSRENTIVYTIPVLNEYEVLILEKLS